MNLVFVAEVRDGCSVDQMASQNGHFLIRRVLISGLGHDENLQSNYSLFKNGFSPFSLGAKQPGAICVPCASVWSGSPNLSRAVFSMVDLLRGIWMNDSDSLQG
jgi:hypothetical protein